MALDFQRKSVTIKPGTGRRKIDDFVQFGRPVARAAAVIEGFKFDYLSDDHHINIVEVDVDVTGTPGNRVDFRVECHYADKNFDDHYEGYVSVLLIADTV